MHRGSFQHQSEKNGLLHPQSCACLKCAAGRDAREIDEPLREKVKEMLDAAFVQMVQGNVMGGFQMLANGQPIATVQSGFLGNMDSILAMREMAAAYFARDASEK